MDKRGKDPENENASAWACAERGPVGRGEVQGERLEVLAATVAVGEGGYGGLQWVTVGCSGLQWL